MQLLGQLVLLFLVATATAWFGYQEAFNYVGKVRDDRKQFRIRLARVDLWSYVLTSVPLFGGLIILLGKDPFPGPFSLIIPTNYADVVSATLLLIASLGIGAGVARRRWVLIAANR